MSASATCSISCPFAEAASAERRLITARDQARIANETLRAALADPTVVETINRYLRRIAVKRVKLADFRPSSTTIEQEQVAQVAAEFQRYLEQQLADIQGDDDTLPMLRLE